MSTPTKTLATPRKPLPHEPPHFIGTADAFFFVTICCRPQGENQLCWPEAARILFESARFYQERGHWDVRLLLLMPDHLHLLARFGREIGMEKAVESWKRFTARKAGICWQRDFFDHRLRGDESLDEKADYISMNPVNAGLVARPEDWPYRLVLSRELPT